MTSDSTPDPAANRKAIVYLAIIIEGGLMLVAIVVGWLFDEPPLSRFRLTIQDVLWGLVATVPMFVAFLAMVRWPIGPLRSIKKFTDEVFLPLLRPCSIIDLLGISCLAGIGEEMFFRGVIQDKLMIYAPWWPALLAAGVLFGLMHAVTPSYVVLATLMGVYLGGVYVLTENLLTPIVTHAAYDFLAMLYLLRGPETPTNVNDSA